VSTHGITKVYTSYPAEGFEWLHPVVKTDYDLLAFDGTPRAANWVPTKMMRSKFDEHGKPRIPSDFPSGSGFIVSRAAKDRLGAYLEEAGELLPLDCPDGEFWALNVLRLVDALDEEKSKILRSSDTGRILMIHRHSLFGERLGPEVFKLSSTPRGWVYFTEAFTSRVQATSLKGINFKLVWAVN
jgi:hypothetical protein